MAMHRHLRSTYSQVSHLCRHTMPPILMTPLIGLQGISTSSIIPGKLLLHEILKSGPNPNSVGTSKFQSSKPNPDTEGATRKISNIDPLLTLLATGRSGSEMTKEDKTAEKKQVVDELDSLESMKTINGQQPKDLENILNGLDLESLTIREACHAIGSLASLNPKSDPAVLEKDERFVRVCNLIQRGNFSLSPLRLILTLQGFQKLGLSANNNIVPELQNELKWVLRRCPIKLLAKAIKSLELNKQFIGNQARTQSTTVNEERSQAMDAAVDLMNRRWIESVTGSDFIAVFGISSHLSPETNEKLEDRAYELVQQFSTMEMVKIVANLAQQKKRPAPLLKAISFHLTKTNDIIPAKDMIELVYALSKINFLDQLLIQKLCHELAPEVHKIANPALLSSLVTALGRIRFKPKELIEAVEDWVDRNFDTMRPFDHAAWLLTCSVLNLKSELKNKFCTNVKSALKQKSTSNAIEWLNIVHAFLVLNSASVEQLASVLQPQFVETIDKLQEQFIGPRMKLLNVNESVRTIVESDKAAACSLDPKYVDKWTVLESTQDESLSKLVLSTLEQFLPPTKYFVRDVRTKSGVFIDAVCAVNSKNEPVPINAQTLQTKSKDVHKVAIVVAGYTSLCLGSNTPTGQIYLHEKLLQAEDYNVILVPYNEFNSKSNLLQRVKYLESRIKNLSLSSSSESIKGTKVSVTGR